MKIVVLDGHTVNPGDLSWSALEALGDLTVYPRTPEDKVIEYIGDAQAVYTNKVKLTAEVFDAAPSIKWVGVLATGYDVIDTQAARIKGIPVCNVANYSTTAVSEMVFALLLELCRRVGAHSDAVMNGEWIKAPDVCFWLSPQRELSGKTMGLVGFGNIGRRTAQLAQAFGMEVLVNRRTQTAQREDGISYVELDELYARADVISLHCPLTEQTRSMIDQKAISKMKDGVFFVNTARGALVDEQALCDALESGKIAGAACDVVSVEPMRLGNPLLGAKNIIITPHMAWATQPSRQRLIDISVKNLAAFLAGRIEGAVNMG